MAVMTKDQIRHQVINLRKTLVLLENSVKKEDWSKFSHKERNDKWLKAQSILSVRTLSPLLVLAQSIYLPIYCSTIRDN